MIYYKFFTATLAPMLFCIGIVSLSPFASAASASVQIEQVSPDELGIWTAILRDGETVTSRDFGVDAKNHTFTVSDIERLTVIITPPAGSTAQTSIYRNGVPMGMQAGRQLSVDIAEGDVHRFVIQYSLSLLGSFGVTSEPSAVSFRVQGPGSKRYVGATPYTFKDIPVGQYILFVDSIEGCLLPPRRTIIVKLHERQVVHFTFRCGERTDTPTMRRNSTKRSIRATVKERERKRAELKLRGSF